MQQAIEEVVDEFNRVDDISTSVTSVTRTADPLVYDEWDGVAAPTIHVGFTDDLDATVENPDAFAATHYAPVLASDPCHLLEAQILFPGWGDPLWDEIDGNEWNSAPRRHDDDQVLRHVPHRPRDATWSPSSCTSCCTASASGTPSSSTRS